MNTQSVYGRQQEQQIQLREKSTHACTPLQNPSPEVLAHFMDDKDCANCCNNVGKSFTKNPHDNKKVDGHWETGGMHPIGVAGAYESKRGVYDVYGSQRGVESVYESQGGVVGVYESERSVADVRESKSDVYGSRRVLEDQAESKDNVRGVKKDPVSSGSQVGSS